MSKIRIHELAKELNISSKTIIDKIKEYGIEASNHMNTLEDTTVKKLKEFYAPKSAKKEEPKATVSNAEVSAEVNAEAKKEQPKTAQQTNNRPQQSNNRPQQSAGTSNNRPQQSGNRPQQNNNRPQQNNNKPQQSTGTSNNRPQQSANRPQQSAGTSNNRPQQGGYKPSTYSSNKPGAGGNRPYGNNKPGTGSGARRTSKKQMPVQPEPKPIEPVEEEFRVRQIPASLSLKELAEVIGKKGSELVTMLFKKGQMININSTLDFDTAVEIAEEYNVILELEEEKDILEEAFKDEPDNEADLTARPPVVVVMGHVDHGKTSLLDAIRHSRVTVGEAGGITQHIGAYTVEIDHHPVTFLDTPGHEAFTAMRMRGAQVTDVAILVVAADDGVMPQTVEAINHAKAAGVEIIVAINKIDKVGANPDRVKQELSEYGILTEDWGGETICVPVSSINKEGIDTLLEMIILSSEMKELKANPKKHARGTIIEAQLDKGRGPVATVLVQEGTLCIGDPVVAGCAYGKIRAMMDDKGRRVKKAGPSTPVEILGLSEVPSAGDAFYVSENEKQARQLAETVVAKNRTEMIKNTPQKVSLDDLFTQIQSGNVKELNIVVKADVQGSVEAVRQSLEKLSNEEVRVRIIHGGVGTITESDVMLASASNAIIIGFNVRPEPAAKIFADEEKVDVRLYRVIYNAIEDISSAMKGMLDPIYEEKIIGHAEVRQLFKASGVGTIAGSYVTDGKFVRGCKVRAFRNSSLIYEGELESLKRFKDDVKEVNTNYECGLVLKKYNDLAEGDRVEAYIMVEVPR
ncbi:MAG TPA: translation initiation factor IF-2 [Lachnospiraceae bacterium]|nr:translation initiation factor IF-2 [Lachnospiraceae bacterium]